MMDNMTNVQTQELLKALRNEIVRLARNFETETGLKVEVVKTFSGDVDRMCVDAMWSAPKE